MANLLSWLGDRVKNVEDAVGGVANGVGQAVNGVGHAVGGAFQGGPPTAPQQGRNQPPQPVSAPRPFSTAVPTIAIPHMAVPHAPAPQAAPKPIAPPVPQQQNDLLHNAANFLNNNIVKPVVQDASKAYNTVAAPITGLTGAAMVGADNVFNGGRNANNLAAATKSAVNENVKNSFVPQDVAQGKATPAQFASDIAKTGIHLAPYAVPGGGALVDKLGTTVAEKVGGNIAGKVAGKVAQAGASGAIAAPTFAALNAGEQGVNSNFRSFDPNQAVKAGLASGATVAGMHLAGSAAKAGTSAITGRVNDITTQPGYSSQTGSIKVPNVPKASDATTNRTQSTQTQGTGEQPGIPQTPQLNGQTQSNTARSSDQTSVVQNAPLASKPPRVQLATQKPLSPEQSTSNPTYSSTNNTISPPKGQVPATTLPTTQRGFTGSVKSSNEVSAGTKKAVSGSYIPQDNASLVDNSQKLTGKNLNTSTDQIMSNLNQKEGNVTPQHISDAISVAKAHDAAGNYETAGNIYNKLAQHGTAAGQKVQAFSLLSNRTPQGLHYSAVKALNKAGVEPTPELTSKLSNAVDNIKAAKPGSNDHYMAVQNLVKTVNDNIPRSKADAAFGIWRAGLISGPETAAKVIASYGAGLPADMLSRPISAAVDKVTSLVTGKRGITYNPITDTKNFASGYKRGVQAMPLKMRTGIDAQNTGGFEPTMGKSTKMTGYEKFVTRLHGSIPKPVGAGTYDMNIAEMARTEAINKGLKGADKQAFIDNLTKNPTKAMQDTARLESEKNTNSNTTALGRGASMVQKLPGGKILAPITRVPSAIGTKALVDMSPLGYLKAGKQLINALPNTKGKFDQRAFSTAMGKATVGTGIAAGGAGLMAAGRMTLAAPSDPKEKALNQAQGIPNNSIYVGGTVTKDAGGVFHREGGTWVSLNATGAPGITAGIGGSYQKAASHGADVPGAAGTALLSGAKLLADQPYLKGPSDFTAAIGNPTQKATTYINSTAGSLVPGFVSQTATGTDTTARMPATDIPTTIQSKIPGLREGLTPQLDAYGKPIPGANPSGSIAGGIAGAFNPFMPSNARNQNDPATTEIQRLYNLQGTQGPDISAATTIQGQPTKQYTSDQVQQFIKDSGSNIQARLNNLVKDPNYQKLSDAQKTQTINKAITAIRQATAVMAPTTGYLPSGPTKQNFLDTIVNYAKAFGTDPIAAFNDITNGQSIIGTAGGGILVQRAGVSSTSALINSRGGGNQNGVPLQLDHFIPLEIGGTNAVSNLQLITKAQDDANNAAENYLGTQLKNGAIDMKTAQNLITGYKNGSINGQQLYSQAGGKGTSTVPNPTAQPPITGASVTNGKKQSPLVKAAAANPTTFGTTATSKTGKGTLTATAAPSDPKAMYQQKLSKFNDAVKAGTLTSAQQFSQKQALAREAVTQNFSPNITQLYSMSKKSLANYLNANPSTAKDTVAQLNALDSQLTSSGVISTPKFKNGVSTSTGTGGRRSSGGSRASKVKTFSVKPYLTASNHIKVPKVAKVPSFSKSGPVKMPTFKIPKISGKPSMGIKPPTGLKVKAKNSFSNNSTV